MDVNMNEGITSRVLGPKDLRDGQLVQRFSCQEYVYEVGRGEGGIWLSRAVYAIEARIGVSPKDNKKSYKVVPYGNGCWVRDDGPWCETCYSK